ncbi:NAD(P)-dependent oxidoreductase [Acrocarpospora phusangensis]|uniref:NAD(P)-dependent oxidoreductase n=1 Tax=Acrocarpospora phusangensis TaxID=1070424 RepID=A0A919UL92_9ACTN|nr:SDR family oxidoreductase [Acrocarpospora phusangensis]GIH25906.1 NAD(P)-dependent oxidoreductase [Acrocarpospora phusangensis]
MPTVAVTGASGHLGRQVAELLLDKGEKPVLITRDPAALEDFARRGADVRHGDFNDPAGLEAALTGVDRVLLISIDITGPQRVELHTKAVQAARAAGVKHVLYTSLPSPEPGNPAAVAPDHRATEAAILDSGLTWTFLRNNIYAEYQIGTAAQAAASGHLYANSGEGATAYVSREDCAAAAAAVLTSEGHENTAYDVTGPDAIDAVALAALTAEITGRPVEAVLVDDDSFIQGLVGAGIPAEGAQLFASFGASARGGWAAAVSTAVRDLTGRDPKSLRELLTANREALGA